MSANLTKVDLPGRVLSRINPRGGIPADPSRPLDSECWLWTGGRFPAGYGSVWLDGVSRLTHQVIYEAVTGKRSDRSLFLDHICRVRACCNPEHLQLVTPLGNQLSAQRPTCKHGHALTPENTYRLPKNPNQRQCRACGRAKQARYVARMKESAA